jgi:hypothetical protein
MTNKQDESIAEQVVKRKSNGKNSPVIGNNGYDIDSPASQGLVSKLLTEALEAYRMPPVKSDEELLDRLDAYFERCASKDIKPTVEEMCLFTGYSIKTIWAWENEQRGGFSNRTAEIIKKSKAYMATFDAKLLLEGKLNPVSYIFRAKNYYGMKDVQDVVLTPNNPLGPGSDAATIRKQIEGLPVVEIEAE